MNHLFNKFFIKTKFVFNELAPDSIQNEIQIVETNLNKWTQSQLKDLNEVIENGLTKEEVISILKNFQNTTFRKGKKAQPKKSAKAILGIQAGLKFLGFFENKKIDGIYGTRDTKPAIEAYQKKWNKNHPEDLITKDGIPGKQTIGRLIKSLKANIKSSTISDKIAPVENVEKKVNTLPEIEKKFSSIKIQNVGEIKESIDGKIILDDNGDKLEKKEGFFKFKEKEIYVKKTKFQWEKCSKEGETIEDFFLDFAKDCKFVYVKNFKEEYPVSIENGKFKFKMRNGQKINRNDFIKLMITMVRLKELEKDNSENGRKEFIMLYRKLLELDSQNIEIQNNIVWTVIDQHKYSDTESIAFSEIENFVENLKTKEENPSINETLLGFYFQKFKETKDPNDKRLALKYLQKERMNCFHELDSEYQNGDKFLKENIKEVLIRKFNKISRELERIEKENQKRKKRKFNERRQNQ